MNLPNAISAARIAVSPLIAFLPLLPSTLWRSVAFGLYLISAVSDYVDGWLARTKGLVTDLGKTLDPLADKLLLVATFVPMLILQGSPDDPVSDFLSSVLPMPDGGHFDFPFVTWFGTFPVPWWIFAVVLGREAFMTVFRHVASRRGVVIAAIWPAKWKAGMQYVWVGAAYFWFAAQTLARREGWNGSVWSAVANAVGFVGVTTMIVALLLTIWSLLLYMRQHGALMTR